MSTERPGHPYANSAVATYLARRIDELRGVRTQREIAAEAGFAKPNIISMLKVGETKLALDRIPALAKALDADAGHLYRLSMQDQWPELRSTISEIFGRRMASANEEAIFLTKWRAFSSDLDPAPNARIDAAVDAMIASLVGVLPLS